jgi:hypothetical protein
MENKLTRLTAVILAIGLAMTACSSPAPSSQNANQGNSAATQVSAGEATPAGGTNGTTSAAQVSLAVGLGSLKAYRSVLKIDFNGKAAGEATQWNMTYSLYVSAQRSGRLLFIDTTNGPADGSLDGLISGTMDGVVYSRSGKTDACSAELQDASQPIEPVVEPVTLAPQVDLSQAKGKTDTLNGVAALHYVLDENSLGLQDGKAQGDIYLAKDGGYVLSYHLQASSNTALFDPDLQGTLTWDYSLTPDEPGAVGTTGGIPLPDDCPPGLGSRIPKMADASLLTQLPGYMEYTSASSAKDIASFYLSGLAAQGFNPTGTPKASDQGNYLEFTNASQTLTVMIQAGKPTHVTLELENGPPIVVAEPTQTGSTTGGETNQNPIQLIALAMGKLLGNDNTPSVFPSYTLSMNESLPSASGNAATTLQADVQGANYHFVLTSGGTKTDAIHFNGQDYSVVNGKAQPGSAMLAVSWAMWKLDPGVMFGDASASTITPQAGTTLEGRQIDVYSIDSSTLASPLPDISMGLMPYVITAIQGTVWIDHATGGLVKADLQFQANVKKPGETTPSAPGKGEFHITVSQIGQVTVSLP